MRCWHTKLVEKPPSQYKHALPIASPVSGELTAITSLQDPISALRMRGEGVALRIIGQQVFSPVSGKIISFEPTCQSIDIKANTGAALQIRFVNDVSLFMGERFFKDAQTGQNLAVGDSLFRFDLNQLKARYTNVYLSVTITNAARIKCIVPNQYGRKVMPSIDDLMTLYV